MKNKISIWQLTIVLLTIAVLGLSALPTIYGKHNTVVIEPVNSNNVLPLASDIQKLLRTNLIEANTIKNTQQGMVLILKDPDAPTDSVKTLVEQQLGSQYIVKIGEQSASPAWLTSLGFAPIKLGLDLYGGVLFVIHVDSEVARSENTQSSVDELNAFLRTENLRGVSVTILATHNIQITLSQRALAGGSWPAMTSFIKTQLPHFDITKDQKNKYILRWKENNVAEFRQELMQQSVSIMRKRIESLGITEAAIVRQGKEHIRIELPGIKDPEQAREIIGTTATLDIYAAGGAGGGAGGDRVFYDKRGNVVNVKRAAILGGVNIKSASSGIDENGMPLVNLVLDQQGAKKMSRFSKKNIGQAVVTVFSQYNKQSNGELTKHSEVINVATVVSQLGSRFSITNMQSPQAAQTLATLIRAGSLNAPLSIVEQRTISPSLGKENVANGFAALALGLGLTMVFMALWYRRLGLVANASLGINLICLLGLMALLPGVVLTLPGIAGLVLTVGMAVDTNVLVFERIKEEVKKKRKAVFAIKAGYERAFSTIVDANITTMICAIILMSMGNGPVRGFAMTLCLGLLTSLFSGVLVARLLTQLFPAHMLITNKEAV